MHCQVRRQRLTILFLGLICVLLVSGCGKEVVSPYKSYNRPYTVRGRTYTPMESSAGYSETGVASWYGDDFHGKQTANGEIYNMYAFTAAHKLLPLGTKVRVVNLDNGRSVNLRVNDRGPFVRGRIIDVSRAAASKLGMLNTGTARVRVETLGAVAGVRKGGDISGRFYVQVASFLRRSNADSLLQELQRSYPNSRVTSVMLEGKNYWRVQAGVYSSLSQASAGQRKLERIYPSSFVIAD